MVSGTANPILVDGSTLTVNGGIYAPKGNQLIIYGQYDGSGVLSATGDPYNAGIGGSHYSGGGTFNIYGGTANAAGGDEGAGIGGEKGTETFASGKALGHEWGKWTSISSMQHQRVCERDPSHVETAKHDFAENICVDCGYTRSGSVDPVTPVKPTLPFADVKSSDWSYDDIYYVWEEGLMNGTAETIISPKMDTSRAMIVTILWRLEGETFHRFLRPIIRTIRLQMLLLHCT